ncbi:TetR/AcrR family transcriptional regulator [Nocardia sp. NEAU-G5]|uniref:TetR/AcrR family transcriptional regulator n=1 Tax=Nocardia albiluteola TaxID=2842303 RepID=A0ABS6AVB9_9NOCA|nr:TetR/AcrR family transcriptional regulator [Nocardia albiluteola]MBU3061974.1 TetR/AcrR family transcriptional regulator [Nocardia albiluteola]
MTRDTPETRSAHPQRGSGRSRGRPPGPPRDPVARRGELLDAAERVATTGTPITIAQVAAEAGYARTAVYAVFPDMPALVDALAERHMASLLASANALLARPLPVRELLRDIVALVCDFVDANPNLYHLMMQRLQSDDATVCGHRRPFFARLSDWGTVVFEAILEAVGADPMVARVWASATAGAILMSAEDWSRTPIRDRGAFIDGLTAFLWPAIDSIGGDRFVGPLIVPAGTGTGPPDA